jgi:hypothetical protein
MCSGVAFLWDGYTTFCMMAVGYKCCKKLILFMYVFIYLMTLSDSSDYIASNNWETSEKSAGNIVCWKYCSLKEEVVG